MPDPRADLSKEGILDFINLEIAQSSLVPFMENFKQSPARNFYIGVRDVVS